MKICIYGAGAIGGYLGAKLTEIGADVTLIARGPHYEAIRQDGLRLRKDGKELVVYPRCVDTCLLYTSPSPRDGLLSRMPSSA